MCDCAKLCIEVSNDYKTQERHSIMDGFMVTTLVVFFVFLVLLLMVVFICL